MVPTLRAILVGRDYDRFQRNVEFLFATGLLVAMFAAYAFGLSQVTGGAIVPPEDATLVEFVATAGIDWYYAVTTILTNTLITRQTLS